MSLGLPLDQAAINARAGSLAIALRDALRMCSDFCDLLQNTNIIPNDQFLLNLNFSQTEINTLRAAFVAAKGLRQVAIGAAAQTPASNFMVDLLKLAGTSV